MYRTKLKLLREKYSQEISNLTYELDSMPPGSMSIVRNGKYIKWKQYQNGKQCVISKKNRPLAEKLAYKKYITLRIRELENEIKAIDQYLKEPAPSDGKSMALLSNKTYADLLSNYMKPKSQELTEWVHMSYNHNLSFPENLRHRSLSGNTVRSKSELLIDIALFQHNLPYRYECALPLNDTVLFPDFTIRHPCTLKTIYWEHFGLMDHPVYSKKAFEKLQLYNQNGILPDVNLIITFETSNHPLDMTTIESKIAHFFL